MRTLSMVALALACVVIVVGAYVRLADAGLGCPDWPGCYGQLTPHHAAAEIAAAHAAEPDGPVSLPKAWKEMAHRYLAAALGLLILVLAWLAWNQRSRGAPAGWCTALVGVVALQGALGMWTVTLLLKPAIVTAHLLGGVLTAGLLLHVVQRLRAARPVVVPSRVVWLARWALPVLLLQVTLGGWTSTNYAALACADLPRCQGAWLPEMDFAHAFHVLRELGMTADGEPLPVAALTAIHWSHRVGAVLVGAVLVLLALALLRRPATRGYGGLVLAATAAQVGLGVANVVGSLPLPVAVAHNAGALVLVLVLVWVNGALQAGRVPRIHRSTLHANPVA